VSEFWVVVLGEGSFSLGKEQPTWRGPQKYEITAEQAEAVLAWKEEHPAEWLIVSTQEPHLPGERPFMFTLDDLRFGQQRPAKVEDIEPVEPKYKPAPDELSCDECDLTFPHTPGLRRHRLIHHTTTHEDLEASVRAQVEREKAAKRGKERVEQARVFEAEALHPAERSLLLDDAPERPSLWPTLPSG
jgi:hypothetical protein